MSRPFGPDRRMRLGYVCLRVWDHPRRDGRGWVHEHTLVMERALGRFLVKGEVVHHINGDRADNRLENLELTTNGEHMRHHNLVLTEEIATAVARWTALHLGRTPYMRELQPPAFPMCVAGALQRTFGSYKRALVAIGLQPTRCGKQVLAELSLPAGFEEKYTHLRAYPTAVRMVEEVFGGLKSEHAKQRDTPRK